MHDALCRSYTSIFDHMAPFLPACCKVDQRMVWQNHRGVNTHPCVSCPDAPPQDHFCWNDNHTQIIGLTPTGRATVEALKMNRPGLVNMRQVLYLVGKHPPPRSEE
jgi:hypothetical protein